LVTSAPSLQGLERKSQYLPSTKGNALVVIGMYMHWVQFYGFIKRHDGLIRKPGRRPLPFSMEIKAHEVRVLLFPFATYEARPGDHEHLKGDEFVFWGRK